MGSTPETTAKPGNIDAFVMEKLCLLPASTCFPLLWNRLWVLILPQHNLGKQKLVLFLGLCHILLQDQQVEGSEGHPNEPALAAHFYAFKLIKHDPRGFSKSEACNPYPKHYVYAKAIRRMPTI